MTWAIRWERFRQGFAEVAEVVRIGRALENGSITTDEAAAAISRIGSSVHQRRTADRHADAKHLASTRGQLART